MTEEHKQTTRLTRSVDDSHGAGVCGGLGEHFGISAWWFRWAFIVLALFGFAGILFYIVAWILIPEETEEDSVATSWMEGLDLSDIGTIFGIVLIGVAGVIILNQVFHVSGALVAAGVLAAVGVLLYRGDLRPPDIPRGAGPRHVDEDEPSPDTESSSDDVDALTSAEAAVATAVATKPPKAKKPPKVKKPKPPPSMLGRLTMAVLLIAVSGMVLADLAGWVLFQPVEYLAAGMGVIAVGLIVGAWAGRARWLIVIGILLAPWLLFAALLPTVSEWTFGDPYYRPASVEEAQDSYSLSGGQMTIDLSNFTAEELAEVGRLEATVSAGNLFVILPLGAGTVVNADVGAGSVDVGVEFQGELGGPPHGDIPQEVINLFEDCLAKGIGDHECEDRYLNDWLSGDSEVDYGEYGWDEWQSVSGIGISRSFDLGEPPRDFVLDLSVGAGGINIQQVGERYADDSDEG